MQHKEPHTLPLHAGPGLLLSQKPLPSEHNIKKRTVFLSFPENVVTLHANCNTRYPMIEIRNLKKSFGETVACDMASFKVNDGEVLGLVGNNGA